MTKQQAADFIGISPRTLERAVSKNKIGARYEKGKTSDVLVFDPAEVERYKAAQDSPTHLPTVERAANDSVPNRMNTPSLTATKPDNRDTTLATFGDVSPMSDNAGALALLQMLSQLQPAAAPDGPPLTPPSQKLLLSLPEAQSYSGLSRANLMEAIHDESLAAQKIGRGWKIKRRDLESYIEQL